MGAESLIRAGMYIVKHGGEERRLDVGSDDDGPPWVGGVSDAKGVVS